MYVTMFEKHAMDNTFARSDTGSYQCCREIHFNVLNYVCLKSMQKTNLMQVKV